MKEIHSKNFLDINDPKLDLKALFEHVRRSGRLIVKDGEDFFSIEKAVIKISGKAREILAGGGPVSYD